jgi:PAS domain S-box-containing protein
MDESSATPTDAALRGIDEQSVFRTLFAASPDALIVADAHGIIVLANSAAADLLGYAIDELIGLEVDALVPDGIRPRHGSYREAYSRNPRPRPMGTQMELVARRRDGSEVMVEIALSPLQNHGLPLVVAAIRDIAAYPRMKQALQRARYSEHLAQVGRLAVDARDAQVLLQHVPEIAAQALAVDLAAVFLLEPNGLEFRVRGGTGLLPGEGIGALVPNQRATSLGCVVAQGRPVVVEDYRTEQRFAVPPGYLAAGLRSGLTVPISDRGRVTGALAARSRTSRRFGDDELRFLGSLANLLSSSLQRAQSEEALGHAQRLESVGQLTGGIAHDFNNLLTVIQGNLQVLEELPALAADAYGQQLVAAAARASRRGAELTGKLLAFSRRQVLQPRPVDARAMLNSLADMLRRTLDQRIRIEVDAPDDCPAVIADPGQLESALLNIAINARDAMPEGGMLRFAARACEALPAAMRHQFDDVGVVQDGFVGLSISDTGRGMPDAVKERAFEPFFTTKEAGRGTGLGLSTVYGFVKQSRGAVSIDSVPGAGTTLTLYIPSERRRAGAEDADPSGETIPAGLHVLMVEDDAEVAQVVRTFLTALGCTVTAASQAEQALMALEGGASFDVLLTDIALGAGMRGTQLATEAQRRLPDLAILLMSGYPAELLEADRDAPPSWELLQKPFSRSELARSIATVISGRREGA